MTPVNKGASVENVEHFFKLHGSVEVLEADDRFKRHMRERGRNITVTEIALVHNSPDAEYFDNEDYNDDVSRAPVIMLGYSSSSRFLTVPIDPVGGPGVWRVRTAYLNNLDDEHRYREYKQGVP